MNRRTTFPSACGTGLALFMLLAGGGGCRPAREAVAPAPRVYGDSALEVVTRFVELGPRISGTAGAAQAAEWIRQACLERGYDTARIDEWTEETVAGEVTFRNVVAVRKGDPKRRLIVGSHYDTKYLPDIPDFVGANDSGSSTGLLLEMMRVMADVPVPRNATIEFMFFDGEECRVRYGPRDGLHGSRRIARKIRERGDVDTYIAMILLDMVGDADLRITLPLDTDKTLATAIFQIAREQGVRDAFGYFLHGTILDDHVPFMEIGIPSVNMIDFEYGPANRYWHTAEDTLDKLSAASLRTVGDVALELVWRLAAGTVVP